MSAASWRYCRQGAKSIAKSYVKAFLLINDMLDRKIDEKNISLKSLEAVTKMCYILSAYKTYLF
jgi:hypothetical protein